MMRYIVKRRPRPPVSPEVPCFATLDQADRAALLGQSQQKTFKRGDALAVQGQAGSCLFLLLDGECSVSVAGPDGAARKVVDLGPGDYFGEKSLLQREIRSATVTASTPTRALLIQAATLEKLELRSKLVISDD